MDKNPELQKKVGAGEIAIKGTRTPEVTSEPVSPAEPVAPRDPVVDGLVEDGERDRRVVREWDGTDE